MKRLAILIAGTTILAACQTGAPPPPPPGAAMIDPNDPRFAPGFMAQAASGGQFEIESSQLALQMSQNAAVRNFANMMIADHSRLNQAVAAAAMSARLTPPAPVLLPSDQAMFDQLRAAGAGPGFDLAYKNAQITAHQNALQLMQAFAANGDVPALRNAAAQAVPVVQMHLNQAQALPVAAVAPPPPPPPPPRRAGERG
jgi:putative membrane protein